MNIYAKVCIIQLSLDSWVVVTLIVVAMMIIMNRSCIYIGQCVYNTTFIRFLGSSTHIVVPMMNMNMCCVFISNK